MERSERSRQGWPLDGSGRAASGGGGGGHLVAAVLLIAIAVLALYVDQKTNNPGRLVGVEAARPRERGHPMGRKERLCLVDYNNTKYPERGFLKVNAVGYEVHEPERMRPDLADRLAKYCNSQMMTFMTFDGTCCNEDAVDNMAKLLDYFAMEHGDKRCRSCMHFQRTLVCEMFCSPRAHQHTEILELAPPDQKENARYGDQSDVLVIKSVAWYWAGQPALEEAIGDCYAMEGGVGYNAYQKVAGPAAAGNPNSNKSFERTWKVGSDSKAYPYEWNVAWRPEDEKSFVKPKVMAEPERGIAAGQSVRVHPLSDDKSKWPEIFFVPCNAKNANGDRTGPCSCKDCDREGCSEAMPTSIA